MKRPTQNDVARLAGVSRATVSYVLNGVTNSHVPISPETTQRVMAAIAELGYEPDAHAQALQSGKSKSIGLIIPDLRNPHFIQIATGVLQKAQACDYRVLISSPILNKKLSLETLKGLLRNRIDGLIIVGDYNLSEEGHAIIENLIKQKFPILEFTNLEDRDVIDSDYRDAAEIMMEYLFSLHHRRIGFIHGVEGYEIGFDRLDAYEEKHRSSNIPIDPELVIHCGPTIEDGYQAARKLLTLPARPTAIIALNDLLSIGVLRAAADLEYRIPQDLSVVGFDDIPMANYLVPRLTTVTKDAVELGVKSFSMLLARIQNPDLPNQVFQHTPKVAIRESTGIAPSL